MVSKVKNKGILFGDDYNRSYGVSKAVAEFSHENKLTVHLSDNDSQYYLIKEWFNNYFFFIIIQKPNFSSSAPLGRG